MSKHNIEVEWSGSYPCLCYGTWMITIDGKDCSLTIPEDKIGEPMNTYKKYSRWYFNDWMEEWEDYYTGLEYDAWLNENIDWVKELPIDEDEYEELFEKIREQDFQPSSCGGCI